MRKDSKKEITKRIEECRQLLIPKKVITCMEQLLEETRNPWVAYELGHEYEKIEERKKAFILFGKAEEMFEDPSLKNMAQAALNRLVIEEILDSRKRKQRPKSSA